MNASPHRQGIAIVGMACRLPGAPSLDAFWRMLVDGEQGIVEVPADRWNAADFFDAEAKAPGKTNTRHGGFIDDIDRFDARFFGISPREAVQMDPQQRVLAELCHEALENAGIVPADIAGSDAAVCVGLMSNEYLPYQLADDFQTIDVHTGSGAGYSMVANRLSYIFDLQGPSFALDSACSSSLVAVFHGCQAIWTGQSSLAIAAGVNLILSPAFNVFYAKGGLSAPDGRCKTFSADANGIGRGEGAGVVILKPLEQAVADGDRIWAVIRGGAVGHDGRSNGLTAPNRWAQEKLLRTAFRHAHVEPDELQYIELHGTGTLIGDPIEANALGAALLAGEHPATEPVWVGSVKSNVGHLEGAAGIAGLIKLALSIHHEYIPPSLNFRAPNPHIAFDALPLRVITEGRSWPVDGGDVRLGGVSSFGLGGTNAHVVLESAPRVERSATNAHDTLWLLLSAKTEAALTQLVSATLEKLKAIDSNDRAAFAAACKASVARRSVHEYRLSVVAESPAALLAKLQATAAGSTLSDKQAADPAQAYSGRVRPGLITKITVSLPDAVLPVESLLTHSKAARHALKELESRHGSARATQPKFVTQLLWLTHLQAASSGIHTVIAEGQALLATRVAAGLLDVDAAMRELTGSRNRTAVTDSSTLNSEQGAFGIYSAAAADCIQRTMTVASSSVVVRLAGDCLKAGNDLIRFPSAPALDAYWFVHAALAARAPLVCSQLFSAPIAAVDLPAYPWQREQYWLPRPAALNPTATSETHKGQDSHAQESRHEPTFLAGLLALTAADRRIAVTDYLREQVAKALRMEITALDTTAALNTLGIDSLTAVEIKNRVERQLRVRMPVVKFLDGYSVVDFTGDILAQLESLTPEEASAHASGEIEGERAIKMAAPPDANDAALPEVRIVSMHPEAELSVTQQRLWQLDQVQPGNPLYNFQTAMQLTGTLDATALEAALAALIDRHESLRTRIGTDKGKPHVEVLAYLSVRIQHTDIAALTKTQQTARIQELATTDAQQRFSLATPPLFRLHCIRVSDDQHVVVLTMHHVISDLLSLEIFMQELGTLYTARHRNKPAELAELSASYQDFAHEQRTRLPALSNGPTADFWREHLAGAPLQEWRSDYPRPMQSSRQARTVSFHVPKSLLDRIDALARTQRSTPYMVWLSAFYALLHGASGQRDLIVGSPTAARSRSEYEPLIGMFSYPIALRAQLEPDASFTDLLAQVRRTVLDSAEHLDLPFAEVVELARKAGAARGPLVRSMFSYVNRMKLPVFDGLQAERLVTDRGMSDFDLFLTLVREDERAIGVVEFSSELFATETARRMSSAYVDLLEAICAEPEQTLRTLTARVPATQPLTLAVAASFTADAVEDVVRLWSQRLRQPLVCKLEPYNQIFQSLLDPASALNATDTQHAVVLVRPLDWVRYHEGDAAARGEALTTATADFINAVQARANGKRPSLTVVLCPVAPDDEHVRDLGAALLTAEQDIEKSLTATSGVELLCGSELSAGYPVANIFDAESDRLGHVPYTPDGFIAMGSGLVRKLSRRWRTPYKVIALDCDNTLWSGVCGEDGALGVIVDGPHRALQEAMVALATKGFLLCLVSKNVDADVAAVFEARGDMPLTNRHIVARRVNWQPKSQNLRELADELQLGLDSFIFIDDNPVECSEVQAACPEVLTLCLPSDVNRIPEMLAHVWAFDTGAISDEDRLRTQSYHDNRDRRVLQGSTQSYAEFIAKLDLKIDIDAVTTTQQARVSQLTLRTNQFNASGMRWDETTLAVELNGGMNAFAVHVGDRFGDYGLVGAVMCRPISPSLRIEGFMLSCRVLGRGVEHRMLRHIAGIAREQGLATVDIVYRKSTRNAPLRRFLDSLPGQFVAADEHGEEDARIFRLATETAATLNFDPEASTATETEASDSKGKSSSSAAETANPIHEARIERIAALSRCALLGGDVAALRAQMKPGSPKKSGNVGALPSNESEARIAEIWREVLAMETVGRNDNFFDIGGTSLLLVQVGSRLIETFGRDIPITDLFQYPTIASLAAHLSTGSAITGLLLAQSQVRGNQARQQMQQRLQRLSTRRPSGAQTGTSSEQQYAV